jgi:Xaa-Pro aminopeptidase
MEGIWKKIHSYGKIDKISTKGIRRMITLKSQREIERMAESGALLAEVHKELRTFIKPGITSWDIEVFVRDYI